MTSPNQTIRAVAFDVDGTLYPNLVMYIRSIPFALAHVRLLRAYSRIRRRIRRIRPIENFAELERDLLSKDLGVSTERATELIEVTIHEVWESVFTKVKPYAHVRSTIEWIRSQGMQVAVSSDFPVERKLKRLGLHDLFDCLFWSADSGYLKPHPEPFAELLECLAVPPGSVLFVGNSYEYDVIGACASGMQTAHLRRRPVRNSIADLTFRDYRQLREWIERANHPGKPEDIQ